MSGSGVKPPASSVNRRNFVSRLGHGALAAGLAGCAQQESNRADGDRDSGRDDGGYDVVVIGGGFAGVTAARDLRKNGKRVLLLEARNRLGGRTFYTDFAGQKVELGGAWIHWSQPYVWAEKERYNLEIAETKGAAPDRILLRQESETKILTEGDVGSVVDAFNAFVAEGMEVLPRPFDILFNKDAALKADAISAQERLSALDLTSIQRDALTGIVKAMAHNSADRMSYLEALRWARIPGNDFFNFMDAVGRYKFAHGTASLLNRMVEDGGADIRLSTPVSTVADNGDHIEVTTTSGETIIAQAVVVTLPMNVLPDVAFVPPLDAAVVDAAAERHSGAGYKVWIKAKGKLGNVMLLSDGGNPISTAFTFAEHDDATFFAGFGSDENFNPLDHESVQRAFEGFFPGVRVENEFAYDWNLDPYSKGTYCCYKPGWVKRYYDVFGKNRGRIFFAQGDHGEGWRGFIDGAIGAGIRAAESVDEFLTATGAPAVAD